MDPPRPKRLTDRSRLQRERVRMRVGQSSLQQPTTMKTTTTTSQKLSTPKISFNLTFERDKAKG